MPVKVVDASALAAILFNEPEADAVAERLEDHRLTAPALIQFEITSVCLKKIRKRPEQRDRLLEALRRYPRLSIRQVPVKAVDRHSSGTGHCGQVAWYGSSSPSGSIALHMAISCLSKLD